MIIPAYNHEEFVERSIESVLNQSFSDYEIIVVDDCSSDDTVKRIKKIKSKKIRLFCLKKNCGASFAMNYGIKKARGEYVSILNSDDEYLPDKLEKQVAFLKSNQEYSAVFSKVCVINEDSENLSVEREIVNFEEKNRSREAWLNYYFYNGNCLCHPSVMVRKNCYEVVGYYNEFFEQAPDFDFWLRFCFNFKIYILDEILIKFRIQNMNKNTSGYSISKKNRNVFEKIEIYRKYFNINRLQQLVEIFPEVNKYFGQNLDVELVQFYLSLLVLKHSNNDKDIQPKRILALQSMYELLLNPDHAENIQKRHQFSFKDFISLSGEIDIFNFYKLDKLLNYKYISEGFILSPEIDKDIKNQCIINSRIKRNVSEINLYLYSRKIILFGTGRFSEKVYKLLDREKFRILCVFDNDIEKQGMEFHNLKVLSPRWVKNVKVIIASSWQDEIFKQLVKIGYSVKDIIRLDLE